VVEYLFAPAQLTKEVSAKADSIARKIINELGMVGLLAVEMFVTRENEVLVNEIAPRPHNRGHHTIEANTVSQYEQHLRAILDLPLGDTSSGMPAAMVNLLGQEGYSGPALYEGLNEVLAMQGVYVHLYGKFNTKPFRKMGHVTIVDKDVESLKKKVNFVKRTSGSFHEKPIVEIIMGNQTGGHERAAEFPG
jgi:5-(carboxyamino)imidazole ribonucleotide synthase